MMFNPEQCYADILQARRFVIHQLYLILLTFVDVVFTIAMFVGKVWIAAVIMTVVAGILILLLVRSSRKNTTLRRETKQCYRFPLPRFYDYDAVCSAVFSAPNVQWTQKCAEDVQACCVEGKFSWRILLLYQPQFSKKENKSKREKANRAVNRIHPSPQTGSIMEVSVKARLNIVVCDTINDELSKYMNTHAETLLRRNEIVLNLAVVGNELLVPPIRGADLDLPSINRYKGSVDLIWHQLCQEELRFEL